MKRLFRCSRCGQMVWGSTENKAFLPPGQPATTATRMCEQCYAEEVERYLSRWVARRQAKLLQGIGQRVQ